MHCAHCMEIAILLMLLSVHVTSVLFLVQFNNLPGLHMDFYWSYTLLLKSPVLMRSCCQCLYTLTFSFIFGVGMYFIVGAIIMKVKYDATGTDLIPNKNFWLELPHLLKVYIYFTTDQSTLILRVIS